ncbi:MAG: lipopolysaccharide transport periplasmic protein LptA, partial [Burkholderiaceae bacterium]|nr:lipopolysaccharide transport periplasmic protein LptA [Burkholderiaceae bacterium]
MTTTTPRGKVFQIISSIGMPPLLLLLLAIGLTVPTASHAEKADANRPTNVEANHMDYDDLKQVNVFTGNVRLVRGTLIIKGEKMVITQDPAGYQHGVVYAPPGGKATFRQKRDGGPNLWVEGEGQRIEYDNKTDIANFYTRAKLRRLEGTKITDEVEGEFVSYDARKEFFSVNNTASGKSKPGAGLIMVVIQPREDKKKTPAKSDKHAD